MTDTVGYWNGKRATLLRKATRLTIEEFAEKLDVSTRMVKHWAQKPDITPRPVTQQILDATLDLAAAEVKSRFRQLLDEADQQQTTTQAPDIALVAPLSTNGSAVGRRALSAELLADFRETLRPLYKSDNRFGPRVLAPLIRAHLAEIETLRTEAHGRMLRDLLSVGAAYAEFAGWLAQDSDNQGNAVAWYNKGLEWAQASGDTLLSTFIRMRLAAQALTVKNGDYAVLWAASAQRDTSPETARIRSIAALTEAHGHALCGDSSEVDRSLDAAQRLLEGDAPVVDGDPTADRYCELTLYSSISQAKCYLELGRGIEAIGSFNSILAELPVGYQRDRGQYMAGLAHAHVLAGQPEEACAVARDSLAIAVSTGSARTIKSLEYMVRQGLSQWPDLTDLVEISATLKSSHKTNGGA